jgi:hypothetical protein
MENSTEQKPSKLFSSVAKHADNILVTNPKIGKLVNARPMSGYVKRKDLYDPSSP